MSEEKSKLELIGEIAQANNKNLELIEEINKLQSTLEEIREYIESEEFFELVFYSDKTVSQNRLRYFKTKENLLQIIDKGE